MLTMCAVTMKENHLPVQYGTVVPPTPFVRMWRQGSRYKFSGVDQEWLDRVWAAYMRSQRIRLEIRAWDPECGGKTDVFEAWEQELKSMVRLFTDHVLMDPSVVDDGGDPLVKASRALASLRWVVPPPRSTPMVDTPIR